MSKTSVIESQFKHKGCQCYVVAVERGYRCGYIEIPDTHPLAGHDEFHGDISSMKTHGRGITFGDSVTRYKDIKIGGPGKWVYGLDFFQTGDGCSAEVAESNGMSYNPITPQDLLLAGLFFISEGIIGKEGNPVRSKEYVEEKLKELAVQFYEKANEYKKDKTDEQE